MKNPLTVIAIFAGLAELGGTAVLPTLNVEAQRYYIWFLMIFPHFIVGLFFLVIWFRHTNLYAPSDYVDEANFVNAASSLVSAKIDQEAAELSEVTDEEVVDPMGGTRSSVGSGDGLSVTSPSSEQNHDGRLDVKESRLASDRIAYLLAEDFAMLSINGEFGGEFKRNVSPANMRHVVFDAVKDDVSGITVVEIKYRRRLSGISFMSEFESIKEYYEKLSDDRRSSFKFIYAVVVGGLPGGEEVEAGKRYAMALRTRLSRLPFECILRIYSYKKLESEYGENMNIGKNGSIDVGGNYF